MYKNILVPVSFEESRDANKAVSVAKLLADKGATITVLHVVEHVPAYAISYMPDEYLLESRKAIQRALEDIAKDIPGGVPLVVEGHSGRTIVEWANENGADCVVVASHRPGASDLILGSTAARVVRHANCAVHVVR